MLIIKGVMYSRDDIIMAVNQYYYNIVYLS